MTYSDRTLTCVDCGTSNVEALTRAHELGMDVVVLDHHLAAGARPPGMADGTYSSCRSGGMCPSPMTMGERSYRAPN